MVVYMDPVVVKEACQALLASLGYSSGLLPASGAVITVRVNPDKTFTLIQSKMIGPIIEDSIQ